MRKLYLLIVLLFLFANCYQTDFKDIDSIAKGFPKALENRDEDFMSELLTKGYKAWVKKNIESAYDRVGGKTTEFLKLEMNGSPHGSSYGNHQRLKVFFRAGDEFFSLKTEYAKKEFGENYQLTSFHLTNLSDLCAEYRESPYIPYNLDINRIQYRFGQGRFVEGKLRTENNTGHDIDYVKLRLKLYNENSNPNTPFFNQTVVSHKKIYKGDIANIPVKGLEGFFIDQYNLDVSFRSELLEVRPKPESEACRTVEELQKL